MMVFCVGVSGLRSVSPHVAITAAVSSVGVQPQQLQDGCVVYTKTPPQMDAEHVAHMHASRNEEREDSHTHTHTHKEKEFSSVYIQTKLAAINASFILSVQQQHTWSQGLSENAFLVPSPTITNTKKPITMGPIAVFLLAWLWLVVMTATYETRWYDRTDTHTHTHTYTHIRHHRHPLVRNLHRESKKYQKRKPTPLSHAQHYSLI